jgi:iron(III) transport system substrate-binding protein
VVAAVLVLAAAILAAGCTSNDGKDASQSLADVVAATDGLTGTARLERLGELARAEGGELSLYTSGTNEITSQIVEGFEDRFGIDVAIYRARDETLFTRLVEEHDAGFAGADVALTNALSLIRLRDRDVVTPYAVDASDLVEGATHDGWVTPSFQRYVAAWHEGTEAPTSWEDFADPRFAGKIAIEDGDYDWYSALRTYWVEKQGMSEEKTQHLFEAIARNAKVVQGHSLLLELVISGEVDAATSNFEHLVENKIAEGAPVAWKPAVEPTFLGPDGLGIGSLAPHPATAALFVEWALTEEGQRAFVDAGYTSVRKDLQKHADVASVPIDVEALAANEEKWQSDWESIVKEGTPAGG